MTAVDSGVPGAEWDAWLERAGGHFLQGSAWWSVQRALGHEVVHDRGEGWGWSGAVRAGTAPRYLYIPYGPTASAAALPAAIASATTTARSLALDFVRIEPTGDITAADLVKLGARPAPSVQPAHTWVVPLDGDEQVLRPRLAETHRRNLAKATNRGLSLRRTADPAEVTAFLALIRKTGAHGGFHPQPDGYYRTVAEVLMPLGAASLYLADSEGVSIAAAIGFDGASTSYYAHAAADPAVSRKLSAGVPLAWRMVLDAQREGRRNFDFWGVAPADEPDHPWVGISRFKRSFGGRPVDRVGTWELPIRAGRYALYSGARRLARGRRTTR